VSEVELALLKSENARLKALLEAHGIPWESAPDACAPKGKLVSEYATESDTEYSPQIDDAHSPMSPAEKVAIFRSLFSGRPDVFALRWESSKGGSGYSPACAHEWERGVCEKPRVKCGDCALRKLLPISDQVIYDHLSGKHTVGIYPLLEDDSCRFLAVDFDEADWKGDTSAFAKSCREFGIPAGIEISRSGSGAHVWVFFRDSVLACDA
jgi:hypothetical protein